MSTTLPRLMGATNMSYFFIPGVSEQIDVTEILRVSATNAGAFLLMRSGEEVASTADFDDIQQAVETCLTINY